MEAAELNIGYWVTRGLLCKSSFSRQQPEQTDLKQALKSLSLSLSHWH